jgi:hypothetical protein
MSFILVIEVIDTTGKNRAKTEFRPVTLFLMCDPVLSAISSMIGLNVKISS